MAKTNIGKDFEERVRIDFKRCFPNRLIYRLPDQQSGYAGGGSSNPCDFFCFPPNQFWFIECKAHAGLSIPFTAIRQYDKMLEWEKKGYEQVHYGVVIWFYDHDKVYWVSLAEMKKMKADGEKSIGMRMLKDKLYNIVELPSVKLRKFMETDYNYLYNLLQEQED